MGSSALILPTAHDLVNGTYSPLPAIIAGQATMTEGVSQLDSPGRPGTIRRFCTVTPLDVDRAARAAEHARRKTRVLTRRQRAEVLRSMARMLERDAEDLGQSICWEVGKSLQDSLGEVSRCVATLNTAAEAVSNFAGAEEPLDAVPVGEGRIGLTIWEPVGVVAGICGFNFPLLLAVHKFAAAIGAGCPTLLKPSDRTPFTTLALANVAIDSGWPAEAVSVLNGGSDVGAAMVVHSSVRLVSFTGSTQVGARIAESAARGLKRVVLELGSNAATIVAPDADLELAARQCAVGAMASTGQSCISVQRIIVHRSIEVPFVRDLVRQVESLRRGPAWDRSTIVGTMVAIGEQDRVIGLIRDAVQRGGRVVTGGTVDDFGLAPTIIVDTPVDARIGVEEAFGPVAAVYSYDELDDAIEMANAVPYGLMAGVFTASLDTALTVARRLEVGGVNVNDSSNFRADNMPYGGVKFSGYGKEGPAHAMREMSVQKVITFKLKMEE